MKLNKQTTRVILIGFFILGFLVRCYRIDNPIADWHSWRQADTSAVSRNFIKHGFDLLHPKFDDLSNVQSKLDNPQGYRFVEFPIYNVMQAGLYKLVPVITLEEWGRLVTILMSLLGGWFLYLLVRKYSSETTALFALFFFLFLPFNIYYGRVILPDPSMVTAILGGVYFFSEYVRPTKKHTKMQSTGMFFLAAITTSVAILLKPYAVFFALPMVYLALERYRFRIVLQAQLVLFAAIALVPFFWWRHWMAQYPEGIPDFQWLFNSNGIRFRPAFFRWLGYERVTRLISGFSGVIFLIVGFITSFKQKQWLFFLSFLVGSVTYVSVLATGNVQHDYYQILVIPTVAIYMALGASWLLSFKRFPLVVRQTVLGVIIVSSLLISWHYIKDYFNINNRSIVIAGQAADRLLPKDAKVIAPYGGDTAFLYQTNRQGWPFYEKRPRLLIPYGANYLILADPQISDIQRFMKRYHVVASESAYMIFQLK